VSARRPAGGSRRPFWIIVAGGAVIIAGIIVWAGATYDSRGESLITPAVATVIVAFLTAVTALGREWFVRVGTEVKDSHTEQVDQSARVAQMLDNQTQMMSEVESARNEVRGVRGDVSQLRGDVSQLRGDLQSHIGSADRRFAALRRKGRRSSRD
jgi:hypothetical protein